MTRLLKRRLSSVMALGLLVLACCGDGPIQPVDETVETATPAQPALEVRVAQLLDRSLPQDSRATLEALAEAQRRLSQDAAHASDLESVRATRSRRRAFRAATEAALAELPADFRAEMHERRVTIHNLLPAMAGR